MLACPKDNATFQCEKYIYMSESLVFVMSSPKRSPVHSLLWFNAQV